nr:MULTISPECIES: IS6 family transposase [Paraburkholderia]
MKKAPTPRTALAPGIAKVLKQLHCPLDVMLMCVRWYVAYGLSLRNLAEMMAEPWIEVHHSTVYRWDMKLLPVLEKAFRLRKRPAGKSWRMDEMHIRVNGEWRYLYRAVDKNGNTVDFLRRAHRDKVAARRYFEKAIEAIDADRETPIKIRRCKYLNNLVEQNFRVIKRRTRPMPGFRNFRCARILLAGIELMPMIAKGQMQCAHGTHPSADDQFYDLVT